MPDTKLTPYQKERLRDFMKLVERSPDRGEGWRSVSAACWPLLEPIPETLVEREPAEARLMGGRCRLTSEGEAVLYYS